MNVVLVDQIDIDFGAVRSSPRLDMVFLNSPGFLNNTLLGIAEMLAEEALPFIVREFDRIQSLNLCAEIVGQLLLGFDREIIVSLPGQLPDEVILHLCLTLILGGTAVARLELGNHCRFGILRN